MLTNRVFNFVIQTANKEIVNAMFFIIRYSIMKEYVKANDKYLELAIGNSAWRIFLIIEQWVSL